MPDDLYECYLLYMKESKASILETITTGERNRQHFAERYKPMSREKFEIALKEMKPEQRAEFELRMRTPYREQIEEGMRETRKALEEFERDPEVRKRVAKEAEAVLAKAKARGSKKK